jgi:hypothetical protein
MKPIRFLTEAALFVSLFVLCTDAVYNFKAASYVLTQDALYNAPTLYATYIDQFMDWVRNHPLPDVHDDDSGCHVEWWVRGSTATKTITLTGTLLSSGVMKFLTIS